MVVCVRVKNTFYSIICTFAPILKLLDLLFPCFPSVTRQSDIDECSSGSYDCHQNATCVNTAGHYDCICKPGLTGNGRNCSGEAIISFHLSNDNRGSPPPPCSINLLYPLKKAWWQERRTLFFPSGETHLVTLRWKGRRDTVHSSLFFRKSGRGANASSQDPRLYRSLG